MKDTFRARWAEPWIDTLRPANNRAAKSIIMFEHMEGGMILRQFQLTREQAEAIGSDLLRLAMEPQ